jgi:hypothetical protein
MQPPLYSPELNNNASKTAPWFIRPLRDPSRRSERPREEHFIVYPRDFTSMSQEDTRDASVVNCPNIGATERITETIGSA